MLPIIFKLPSKADIYFMAVIMEPLNFSLLVSMAAFGPISPVASFFQLSKLAQSSKS